MHRAVNVDKVALAEKNDEKFLNFIFGNWKIMLCMELSKLSRNIDSEAEWCLGTPL